MVLFEVVLLSGLASAGTFSLENSASARPHEFTRLEALVVGFLAGMRVGAFVLRFAVTFQAAAPYPEFGLSFAPAKAVIGAAINVDVMRQGLPALAGIVWSLRAEPLLAGLCLLAGQVKPGVLQEVFNLDEGPVTLTAPATISAASYKDLEDQLELFLRRAKRRITKPGNEEAAN
ncbi:MAG: hypothetical protein ACREB2_10170 [Pseudolabrys sp.]